MIRTQVRLSEQEYEAAMAEARRRGISLAELLRQSLLTELPADENKPWMRMAGMVGSGDGRSSQTIDEIIYGH